MHGTWELVVYAWTHFQGGSGSGSGSGSVHIHSSPNIPRLYDSLKRYLVVAKYMEAVMEGGNNRIEVFTSSAG